MEMVVHDAACCWKHQSSFFSNETVDDDVKKCGIADEDRTSSHAQTCNSFKDNISTETGA